MSLIIMARRKSRVSTLDTAPQTGLGPKSHVLIFTLNLDKYLVCGLYVFYTDASLWFST